MTYEHSIHIAAPVATVFDFFRDPARWQEVAPSDVRFTDVTLTADGIGTHYSWQARIAGVPLEGFDVFTEYVPERRITDRSSSSLEGTWTYTFEPDATGTVLTVKNQVHSFWRLPILEPLLDRVTAKTHGARFDRLKAILEE